MKEINNRSRAGVESYSKSTSTSKRWLIGFMIAIVLSAVNGYMKLEDSKAEVEYWYGVR